jgi:hypothetical protein
MFFLRLNVQKNVVHIRLPFGEYIVYKKEGNVIFLKPFHVVVPNGLQTRPLFSILVTLLKVGVQVYYIAICNLVVPKKQT